MDQPKEWVKVVRFAAGYAHVTVTLQQAHVVVRWTEKAYSSQLDEGVARARAGALRGLSAALEGAPA